MQQKCMDTKNRLLCEEEEDEDEEARNCGRSEKKTTTVSRALRIDGKFFSRHSLKCNSRRYFVNRVARYVMCVWLSAGSSPRRMG